VVQSAGHRCHLEVLNKHCEEDKSVRNHFEYLTDLHEQQLTVVGKAVTNEEYTNTLLASLPVSYDGAVLSMSTSTRLGTKTLTSEIFKQLILDESDCWQVKDKYAETRNEALAMESSGWKGKDKGKDKKKVKCYNCHKTGHYKSECWAKGEGKEGQGLQQGKGAKDNATLAKDKSEEDEAWATIEDIDKPTHTTHSNNVAAAAGHSTMQSSQGHT